MLFCFYYSVTYSIFTNKDKHLDLNVMDIYSDEMIAN